MKISTALGNVTNAGRSRTRLGLSSTGGRLVGRYDNVKALDPLGKVQSTRERQKRG